MKWSKAWFTFVALAGAAGVCAAMIVPLLVQREIDRQVAMRLAAAASAADAQVQLHARRWIDSASHAALDVQLAEALDHASTGTANLDNLHKTAQERIRTFEAEWKAYQVIVVDAHGRVIARAGAAEERWKDDLASAPIVSEALKGFRLDDTWLDGGRLLKVVAAPVIARDRYAGALVVVLDLAAELAQPLADRIGAGVAFVAGGKIVGHSAGVPAVDAALPELSQRAAEPQRAAGSRGEPIALPGSSAHVLLATPIPGGAAGHPQLVVVGERPTLGSPAALKARLSASLSQIPWIDLLPIGGALLAALVLGWFLMGREHSAPLERLYRAAQAISRGEVSRVDDATLPGRHAAIARFFNGALDRLRAARAPSLEVAPPAGPEAFAADSLAVAPDPAPGPSWSAPPLPAPVEPAAAAERRVEPPGPLYTEPPAPSYGSPPAAPTYGSPPAWSPPPTAQLEPPLAAPPPAFRATGYAPIDPPLGAPRGAAMLTSLDEISGVHSLADPRGGYGGPPAAGVSFDREAALSGSIVPPDFMVPPEPAPAVPVDPLEAEFHAVFQDFIDTRQRCGESTDGVTFDKFAAKLRANREQLMSRFNCKGVKFQVYVKDGKAALKATPII